MYFLAKARGVVSNHRSHFSGRGLDREWPRVSLRHFLISGPMSQAEPCSSQTEVQVRTLGFLKHIYCPALFVARNKETPVTVSMASTRGSLFL